MVLDRETTFTWYGHSCFEVRTPGGKVILIDPWFGNPRSPRTADSVEACDLMLVTHGHFDHMGEAVALASRLRPTWPCMHEMSLWLARRLSGRQRRGRRHEQGRHVRGRWTARHDDRRRPLSRRLESGRRDHALSRGAGRASSSRSRTASASTSPATPTCSATCATSRSCTGPRWRSCRSAGTTRWARSEAALAVELLGVKHVIPIHYGTFPLLAGTPDQLRAELAARGLADVQVHAPEPGGTVS